MSQQRAWQGFKLEQKIMVCGLQDHIIGGSGTDPPSIPSVKFISFPYSFRQKSCQIIGFCLKLPRLGNPRSATAEIGAPAQFKSHSVVSAILCKLSCLGKTISSTDKQTNER